MTTANVNGWIATRGKGNRVYVRFEKPEHEANLHREPLNVFRGTPDAPIEKGFMIYGLAEAKDMCAAILLLEMKEAQAATPQAIAERALKEEQEYPYDD